MSRTDGDISPSKRETYQGITSLLIFSIMETRLDIAFAISVVSIFAKNLFHQHIEAVEIILQYLKGSKDRSIIYGAQDKLILEVYSDSD